MMNRKFTKSPFPKLLFLLFSLFLFALQTRAQQFGEEIAAFREQYKSQFLKDSQSPLKKEDIAFLTFYEPDESFRVKCQFKPLRKSEPFELPTSSGKTKTYVVFGQLKFRLNGQRLRLNVYRSPDLMRNPLYEDYLFIPFKDLTNGKDTYGGGRYLDLRMREIEGDRIWLDFNKAYNPYCAFSEGYSCPIPPKENHLKTRVEAGEKNFGKEKDY